MFAPLQAIYRRSALGMLAAVLGVIGALSLIAAGFVGLIPVLGVAGALALNGLTLLVLAVGALSLSRRPGPVVPVAATAMAADPLVQMVFDLSFSLGSQLARRRR